MLVWIEISASFACGDIWMDMGKMSFFKNKIKVRFKCRHNVKWLNKSLCQWNTNVCVRDAERESVGLACSRKFRLTTFICTHLEVLPLQGLFGFCCFITEHSIFIFLYCPLKIILK